MSNANFKVTGMGLSVRTSTRMHCGNYEWDRSEAGGYVKILVHGKCIRFACVHFVVMCFWVDYFLWKVGKGLLEHMYDLHIV